MTDTQTLPTETENLEEALTRADKAEKKLESVCRYLFGALLLLMEPDEIMARLVKRGEGKKK